MHRKIVFVKVESSVVESSVIELSEMVYYSHWMISSLNVVFRENNQHSFKISFVSLWNIVS